MVSKKLFSALLAAQNPQRRPQGHNTGDVTHTRHTPTGVYGSKMLRDPKKVKNENKVFGRRKFGKAVG